MSESPRYLAILKLRGDSPFDQASKQAASFKDAVEKASNRECLLAFISSDARSFGMLFTAYGELGQLRIDLDRMTANGDTFLLIKVGDFVADKGFGAAATWLQRH